MKKPLFLLSLILFSTMAAHADHLNSPWDDLKVTATGAPYKCPEAPAFAKTLTVEGCYTDSHYSVIDPAKKAAYEKAA
jgi:poly(beta-D-mannuronate) lyase